MKHFYLKFVEKTFIHIVLGLSLLLLSQGMRAATITSNAVTGNWNAGGTWVGGAVPTAADNVIIVSGATVTITASITMNAGTTVTVNSGGILKSSTSSTITSIFDTLVVAGTYTNGSIVTVLTALSGAGNFDNGPTGTTSTLTISGAITVTTLTIGTTANTVNYNGGNQTIKEPETIGSVKTYRKLNISGGGTKSWTQTIANTAQGLTLANGTKLNIGGNFTFTFGTIGSTISDAVTFDSAYTANRNVFLLTIDSTGSITDLHTNGGTLTIAGGVSNILTNNGTIKVNSVNINSLGSITNNGTLTCNAFGTGTGTLTNAGTLNFAGSNIPVPLILTATAAGNTVNYSTANQTVKDIAYNNLTLSGSGTKTLPQSADMAVSGNLTIGTGVTLKVMSGSVNPSVSISSGNRGTNYSSAPSATFTAAPAGGVTATGIVILSGGAVSSVTITNPGSGYTTAPTVSFSGGSFGTGGGTAATATGTTTLLAQAANKFTVAGTTTNNGTLNFDALAGTGDKTFTTFNNPGTFTSTASGTFSFTTADYSGAAQTILPGTYTNLTLSGSGNKTISTAASGTLCSGTLTISGTAKASVTNTNVSVGKLSLGGEGQPTGTYGSTNAISASNKNDTYFDSAVTGYLNVTTGDCNKPTISAGSTTTFCAGGSVILTSSAESGNQWYKDGVLIPSATATTYNATTSGTYTVITTSASASCSSVASDGTVVTVNALPTAGLTSSDADNTFCVGTSVTFTATGGTNYNFRVDGSNVQNGATATYTTTTLTNGQVVDVIVTNASGCVSTSAGITNTVNGLPTAGLTSSDADNTFCAGTSVTFTATGGANYNFKVDGSSVQNSASDTYTTTALTNGQVVTVDVINASGCVTTSTGITNTVNALPTAGLTSDDADNTFCTGTLVTFTATGGTNYNFKVDGSSVQNSASATYATTTLSNGQVVTVDVANALGCVATSVGITDTVNSFPTAGLTSSDADNIFCAGTSVTFTVTGGGTNYNFRVAGSSVQNGASSTYTTTALTNGQVVDVIVTNASGCVATSTGITNTVNALPTAGLTSSIAENTFCAGTSVTFTATGGVNYNFKVAGSSVQNSTSATYTTTSLTNGQVVTVDVTNASGCVATSSGITNTVNPNTTDGSVTLTQIEGSYTWPVNNVTYTSTTTQTVVSGCNTATLKLTILPDIPGDEDNGGILDGTDYPIITQLTSDGTTIIAQSCGGSSLVIKGSNFTGATAVKVNGVDVTSFVVNNSNSITAVLPSAPLTGLLTVTSPIGTGSSSGNFTVNTSTSESATQTACDSYTWTAGTGVTYTTSGTYTSTGTNAAGCTHVKTLVLTINRSTSESSTQTACDSYTWTAGTGATYTTSGTYTSTGTNAAGCTHTKTLVLTITPSTTTGSVTQSQIGGSYTWPANGVTYTSSTTQTVVSGCNTATLNLTITPITVTTWNGIAWSYGAPSLTVDAIFAGNYTTTNGAITSKNLTVNAGKTLTVAEGTSITVANALVNNGTITVENNANLIQTAVENTNSGSGTATVKRNSNSLKRLDYTMWSSPVTGAQTLLQFSPLTSASSPVRFYTYNPTTNLYASATVGNPFATGTGYLIRMPNEKPGSLGLTTDYYKGLEAITYNGLFTGTLNNGTITLSNLASNKYYSVGNPYPSTISANAFLSGNETSGTLYFWRKTNGTGGTAYATYTANLGGAAGGSDITPNGTIQVGQGFIVKTGSSATSLSFTNAMRTSNTANQFLKTKNVADKSRLWFDLSDATGRLNQVLIGYLDGATVGFDDGIDGKYFNDSKIALTSIIEGEEYVIQGRPKFDATDVVALGFKTDVAGTYSIALNSFDGVFAAGLEVYLIDAVAGKVIDLKTGSYSFTATVGVDNARFSLKYQKTLRTIAPEFTEDSVLVTTKNGIIHINTGRTTMSKVELFDTNGRLVFKKANINNATTTIDASRFAKQVLIVKIADENNKVVTKKLVN